MRILLSGALGRLARAVAEQALEKGDIILGGVDVMTGSADFPLYQSFENAPIADVVIDSSAPQALPGILDYCVKNHVPAVLCTTGYDEAQLAAIDEASKRVRCSARAT